MLPGPIPQVSVYGLPGANRENQGKVSQVSRQIYNDLRITFSQIEKLGHQINAGGRTEILLYTLFL